MRRISGLRLVLGSLLLVAGCETETMESAVDEDMEDRTPREELKVAADTSEGFEGERPVPVVPTQGGPTTGGALTAMGNFRTLSDGAAAGTVTVTQEGAGTLLLITADRFTEGTQLQPVITRGSCGERGSVLLAVEDTIRVGAEGVASLESRVGLATERLLDGTHSIRLVNPDALGGGTDLPEMVFACADLPPAGG